MRRKLDAKNGVKRNREIPLTPARVHVNRKLNSEGNSPIVPETIRKSGAGRLRSFQSPQ
jgi:hypothetical protein